MGTINFCLILQYHKRMVPPNDSTARPRVIGLIPAAGYATRLGPLPCSKEILPIGTRDTPDGPQPKAVSHYLLEKMRLAGITEAIIVLREGKWDIPAHYKDGAIVDMRLAYLVVPPTAGPPYTLDYAYPFVRDAIVALGFPDILFEPNNAYVKLLEHRDRTNADVVLGLFPADRPETMDVVAVEGDGRVEQVLVKPAHTTLRQTWGIAVWTPAFTDFLHDYLQGRATTLATPEMHVGHIIQSAIDTGMKVQALEVSQVPFTDVGIPENLASVQTLLSPKR
jgi:glucose-1-phosphate thymidylyltransferase